MEIQSRDTHTLAAQLEAVLFVHGEPMEVAELAKFLKKKPEEIRDALQFLKDASFGDGRGITLLEHEGTLQLVTKQECASVIEAFTKHAVKEELTPATLEALSIVAYAGPLSRAEIEYVRGVNSSFTLRNLLIRGLLDRRVDPKRQNAYLYFVSNEFLKHLGLTSVEELPEYARYHALRETFERTTEHTTNETT